MSAIGQLIDPILPRREIEWLPTGTVRYPTPLDRPGDADWEADDQIQQVMAVHSFAAFVDYMWPILHPGTPFIRGWHIDLVCFSLEQLAYGRVEGHELLINIPPRMLKSILVNVLFPSWVWLWSPWAQIMGISGSENIAIRDNGKMRQVLVSERYQRLMRTAVDMLNEHGRGPGEYWELTKDQNQKQRFQNTLGGVRFALAAGSKVTGEGMHLQLVDDMTDAKQVSEGSSEQIATRLSKDVNRYDGVLATRMNNPGRNPRVVIMQRLHEADLAGAMLARGVANVVLPMEFQENHPYRHPLDPRSTNGELLLPGHYPPDVVKRMKREEGGLGAYGYAAQMQQLPAPIGGGMFPKELWSSYMEPPTQKARQIQQQGGTILASFDCAAKTGSKNAFSVCVVVGYLKRELYVLGMYRARVDLPGLEEMHDRMLSEWPGLIDEVLIEDASAGTQLLQTRGGTSYSPQAQGGKTVRAGHTQAFQRHGRLLLPVGRSWVKQLVREHSLFPNGSYADIVDALAQAAMHIRIRDAGTSGVAQVNDRMGWLAELARDPTFRGRW